MPKQQSAALWIMRRFAAEHRGDPSDIYQSGQSWRWEAPDGRTACLGWEL